jgi:hypothetical protein
MNTEVVKNVKGCEGHNVQLCAAIWMRSSVRARFYLAHIKRAEADYFERIKRATALVTGDGTIEMPAPAPAPEMTN